MCSCHTRRWHNQSGCSQWCSYKVPKDLRGHAKSFQPPEGKEGLPCLLHNCAGVRGHWCVHWGTWSSWPSPLRPCWYGWGGAPAPVSCNTRQLLVLADVEGEVVVLAPHCQVFDLLPVGCLIVIGDDGEVSVITHTAEHNTTHSITQLFLSLMLSSSFKRFPLHSLFGLISSCQWTVVWLCVMHCNIVYWTHIQTWHRSWIRKVYRCVSLCLSISLCGVILPVNLCVVVFIGLKRWKE